MGGGVGVPMSSNAFLLYTNITKKEKQENYMNSCCSSLPERALLQPSFNHTFQLFTSLSLSLFLCVCLSVCVSLSLSFSLSLSLSVRARACVCARVRVSVRFNSIHAKGSNAGLNHGLCRGKLHPLHQCFYFPPLSLCCFVLFLDNR